VHGVEFEEMCTSRCTLGPSKTLRGSATPGLSGRILLLTALCTLFVQIRTFSGPISPASSWSQRHHTSLNLRLGKIPCQRLERGGEGGRLRALPPSMQAESQGERGRVLVTGASGRTGRLVVQELLRRGERVRAMVRDTEEAARPPSSSTDPPFPSLEGAEVVRGDVARFSDVESAIQGCRACVACHGSERPTNYLKDSAYKMWDPLGIFLGAWGPSRPDVVPAEWGEDFSWLDPGTEESHPVNSHYFGACNIVDAAESSGSCSHVVFLSDAACALHPMDPRAISANLAGSMGIKWRSEAEVVVRNATELGYTIVRVPHLTDRSTPPEGLELAVTGNGGAAHGEEVGRAQVASVVGDALSDPRAMNTTVAVSWAAGGSEGEVFAGVGPDEFENRRRAYSHAAGGLVMGTITGSIVAGILAGVITERVGQVFVEAGVCTVVPLFLWSRIGRENQYYPGQEPQPEGDDDPDTFRLWRKEEDRL